MERSMFVIWFICFALGSAITFIGFVALYFKSLFALIIMVLLIVAFVLYLICTFSEIDSYMNEHHYE